MRRRRASKRKIKSDPKYNNKLVSNFIGCITRKGKKSIAESIVYNAIDILNKGHSLGEDQLSLLKKAVDNVKPFLEVKSRRVGGATYQIPIEIKSDRRIFLAIRWIMNSAKARSGKSFEEKLASELQDALNNTGGAVKKREDTHRMAEANRAFAHYRW